MDLRLAVAAAIAWATTIALLATPGLLGPAATLAWVSSAAVVGVALTVGRRHGVHRSGRVRRALQLAAAPAAVCLVAAAVVLTSAAVREPGRHPEVLAESASSGRLIELVAVTTQKAAPAPTSASSAAVRPDPVRMSVTGAIEGGEMLALEPAVPVLVFDGAPESAVGIGATLLLSGSLTATDPGVDAAYLVFAAGPATVEEPPPWTIDWANGLRQRFADAAARLPGDGGRLLPGLAIGDTTRVDEALDSAMKVSSLSHLTAVSGDTVSNTGASKPVRTSEHSHSSWTHPEIRELCPFVDRTLSATNVRGDADRTS